MTRPGWLLGVALLWPLAATQEAPRELRVRGLSVLRGVLPPPAPGVLDGLGTAPPCPPPAAPLDRVLYERLRGGGAALSCGHAAMGLLRFGGEGAAGDGFSALEGRIRGARREVLLANMVWDGGPGTPGALLAGALADLRRRVRANPEAYPGGVTVRVLLGNSVRFDNLADPTANALNAARDLLEAGLPLNGAPEPGWRLDLANYRYAVPHSHMKLLVIDGRETVAGGFNISSMHLPTSSGGEGLRDLGLWVRGPVARAAAAAFRDAWGSGQEVRCGLYAAPATVRRDCWLGEGAPGYPLAWFGPPEVPGGARVYGLYRRNGYPAGDEALTALLGAARERLDLLQSQVSGDLACDLTGLTPRGCSLTRHGLPVWRAVAAAVRERRIRVRLVLDRVPVQEAEARALLGSLRAELRPLGLEDHISVRWAGHRLHAKAAVVDGRMAVVGSTNLHFSSFGPGGLTEYDLATSDPGAVNAVAATFEDEWRQARPLDSP